MSNPILAQRDARRCIRGLLLSLFAYFMLISVFLCELHALIASLPLERRQCGKKESGNAKVFPLHKDKLYFATNFGRSQRFVQWLQPAGECSSFWQGTPVFLVWYDVCNSVRGGIYGAFTSARYFGDGGGALPTRERALSGLASIPVVCSLQAGTSTGLSYTRDARTIAHANPGGGGSRRFGNR